MKPLVILNTVLALVLSSIIVLLLIERQQTKNREISDAFETLRVNHAAELEKAWVEGYLSANDRRNKVIQMYSARNHADSKTSQIEATEVFWAGTNSNPYLQQRPR